MAFRLWDVAIPSPSRDDYLAMIRQTSRSKQGLTFAGEKVFDGRPGGTLQTVNDFIFQHESSPLPRGIADLLRDHGAENAGDSKPPYVVIAVRKGATWGFAVPGGMEANAYERHRKGVRDRNVSLGTALREADEETGIRLIADASAGKPGIDFLSQDAGATLYAGTPGGGDRSDSKSFIQQDWLNQSPVGQDDVVAAGSISIRDLLTYMANGGGFYGDKRDKVSGQVLERGKTAAQILKAIETYERSIRKALADPAYGQSDGRRRILQKSLEGIDEVSQLRSEVMRQPGMRQAFSSMKLSNEKAVEVATGDAGRER